MAGPATGPRSRSCFWSSERAPCSPAWAPAEIVISIWRRPVRSAARRTDEACAGQDGEGQQAGNDGQPAARGSDGAGGGPADRRQGFREGGDARRGLAATEMAAPGLGAEPELDGGG